MNKLKNEIKLIEKIITLESEQLNLQLQIAKRNIGYLKCLLPVCGGFYIGFKIGQTSYKQIDTFLKKNIYTLLNIVYKIVKFKAYFL
jgi:hypothetical protein